MYHCESVPDLVEKDKKKKKKNKKKKGEKKNVVDFEEDSDSEEI